MNKVVFLLSFILVIEICSSLLCEEYTDLQNANTFLCGVLKLPSEQTHCCYVPEDDEIPCWGLTDDEYENIKRFKSFSKQFYEMDKLTIKCEANNISSSL